MPSPDLAAIEARAAAATEGPWELHYTLGMSSWPIVVADGIGLIADVAEGGMSEADAAFIAHIRTDVVDLVAEVRRLRAEVDAYGIERTLIRGYIAKRHHEPYLTARVSQQVLNELEEADWQIRMRDQNAKDLADQIAERDARIRELEAENAKIDDLDEALRQRDREILGLRRDRDARDARIGELEAAHDLMASQFKIMQAEKEHGWREAARMEAKLERLSS